jgi:hypothetical protein
VAEESGASSPAAGKSGEKLVEVDTPRQSNEDSKEAAPRLAALANGDDPADDKVEKPGAAQPNGSAATDRKSTVEDEIEGAMKTIEI